MLPKIIIKDDTQCNDHFGEIQIDFIKEESKEEKKIQKFYIYFIFKTVEIEYFIQ